VVECTGLENRQGRKALVSSNLTLSANLVFSVVSQIGRTGALNRPKFNFKIFRICSRTGGADTAHSCAQNQRPLNSWTVVILWRAARLGQRVVFGRTTAFSESGKI
jgi:hypothetical protein